ncbi:protein-tyrosine phosphatase [Loa loa]|uniref:Protein-tyrosine phosphatase n=2 Tax=Loa loa TaxID=7209 RepID=A0A1S0TR14_LOALO|nr:protein-tyrosine phosphatase [Loa loa]EFO18353.2 protein-tyrosine phosphatase [Loa loa]
MHNRNSQKVVATMMRISALANIVQRFGSRVREALATASEAISNAVVDNDPITTPVESMSRFIKDMNEKGMAGLASEYRKIDMEDAPFGSHKAFLMNMSKNRYSDVLCVDETRVVLKIGSAASGDYIHANYVLFSELQNKFICTQGPLQTTRDDFWRMVFQERAETILMLCRPSEDGKPKCAVYWPENGDKLELSTVDVEKVGEENSDFEILLFKVQLKDEFKQSPSVSNKDPLVVKQYRWSTWPDRGIPSHENAMIPLKLLSLVRNTGAPCVVHCSAGIGRTGTVVAIELGIRRFHDGRKLDLAMLVKDLRKKRAQCIQTEIQYLYLSRVLTEYALSSGEPLSDDVRRAAESFLKEYDSKIKK